MKQVEIITSQNVAIHYPLAPLADRIIAFFIDLIIVSLAAGILGIIALLSPFSEVTTNVLSTTLIVLMFTFYHLIMESIGGGRSYGKKALGIKPIKQNGDQIVFSDCLMRWVFRVPDILMSLGSLAIILISSSSKSQRLGDFLAGTVVIKTNDINHTSLRQLLNINKLQENYQAKYPEVKLLSDKDILLIKEVIYREKNLNNEASRMALIKISKNAAEILQIKEPAQKEQFLKDLVSDYVFLTR